MGRRWVLYRLGEAEEALVLAKEAYALSSELAHPMALIRSLNLLGVVNEMLGQYEIAIVHKEQALAIAREQSNREWEAGMLNNLAEGYRLMGDYAQAVSLYQAAVSIAREIGCRSVEPLILSNLGLARVRLGECAGAETELRQVIERVGEKEAGFLAETYTALAGACLGQGKLVVARQAARQALALAQASEDPYDLGGAWRVWGQVVARLPRPEGFPKPFGSSEDKSPGECFAESARAYAEAGMEGERARTLQVWAAYELAQGDAEKGEAMWQEARAIYERLNLPLMVQRMEEERSRWH